jgi:hypothetical protein
MYTREMASGTLCTQDEWDSEPLKCGGLGTFRKSCQGPNCCHAFGSIISTDSDATSNEFYCKTVQDNRSFVLRGVQTKQITNLKESCYEMDERMQQNTSLIFALFVTNQPTNQLHGAESLLRSRK